MNLRPRTWPLELRLLPRGGGIGRRYFLVNLIGCLWLMAMGQPAVAGLFSRPVAYSLDIAYSRFPARDVVLENWLDAHRSIRRIKVTRQSNHLNIRFETTRSLGIAILQEVVAECDELGYQGRSGFNGKLFDAKQQGSRFTTFWVSFNRLPADDRAVTAWLKAQPGAGKVVVRRETGLVVFEFENSDPPDPALNGEILRQCEQNGYQGRLGFMHAFGRYP